MISTKLLKTGIMTITVLILSLMFHPHSSKTAAQDSSNDTACTTLVVEALQTVGSACAEIGRNETCYGHNNLDATFRADSSPRFEESGDLTEIIQLESLNTQPLNLDTAEWGVAVMLVQADLPDESDSDMTFVLMGDTQVESTTETLAELPTCSATNDSANNLNIRQEPSTTSEIVGTISPNAELAIDGRNAAGDWLHINSDDTTGWVFSSLITLDCEANPLTVLNATGEQLAPMQAFTLQTSSSGTCETVPDGLLIRSPEGQRARVIVNGVELVFSSAGYLSTPTDEMLSIQGLEGEIEVTADGQTEMVMPDFYTTVPLDNLQADGPPAAPQFVTEDQLILLPTFNMAMNALADNEIGGETYTLSATSGQDLRGFWRNTDSADGSLQVVSLHPTRAFYIDFGASVCGVDASGSPLWHVIGQASSITYTDSQATATFDFRCLGGSDVAPFSIELTFTVVDENTLEDSIGEIWTR